MRTKEQHLRQNLYVFSLLLTFLACTRPSPHSQSAFVEGDPGLTAQVDTVATRAFAEMPLAGFSIAIQRGGEIVLAKGYGYAHLEARIPASVDTIYRIGSIGKQFTAAAVLRLAQQGHLSLNNELAHFLPAIPSHWDGITVYHLLSHTSGISDSALGPLLDTTSGVGTTLNEAIGLCAAPPLTAPPGQRWSYSNCGYMIAGQVIERAARRPYADYIADEVFQPAGLQDTSYCSNHPRSVREAHGYELQQGNWTRAVRLGRPLSLVPARPINMEIVYSAGAICSTVLDLLRWTQALGGNTFLTSESYRAMTEPATLQNGTTVPYGLGFQLRNFGVHRAIAHGGIINGFVSMLTYFPEDDVTVALLVNTLLPEPERLLNPILRALFQEPEAEWWYLEPEDRNTS